MEEIDLKAEEEHKPFPWSLPGKEFGFFPTLATRAGSKLLLWVTGPLDCWSAGRLLDLRIHYSPVNRVNFEGICPSPSFTVKWLIYIVSLLRQLGK